MTEDVRANRPALVAEFAHHMPRRGLSLGSMVRAALATTSIASHEARIAHTPHDPRMHMTIDELRALPGGVVEQPDTTRQDAKRARRAARLGDVPVVINRRAPVPAKPKRKSRAKNAA